MKLSKTLFLSPAPLWWIPAFFLSLNYPITQAESVGVCSADPSDFGTATTANGADDSEGNIDVLIVGSGWAGIGVARELTLHNQAANPSEQISYVGLEALQDVGGRAAAAHWLSGCEGNPIYEFAWNLFKNQLPIEFQDWSDIQFFDIQGKKMKNKDVNEAINDWADAYECIQIESREMIDNDLQDESVAHTLKNPTNSYCSSWDPPNTGNLRRMLEWYELDYEFAESASQLSTKHSFPLSTYDDFQEKSCFVGSPDNSAVIARAVVNDEGVIDPARIFTQKKVCRIDWGNLDTEGRAKVYVCDSDDTNCVIYRPYKVVSTVSQGYMDVFGEEFFQPVISGKLDAMRNVFTRDSNTMALYKEIKFQFDTKWWSDYQFLAVETNTNGRCNWWQNYHTKWKNEFFYGSNTLVCVLTTEAFEALDPLDGGKVRQLLAESLGNTEEFGDAVLPFVDSSSSRACTAGSEWDAENSVPSSGCKYYIFQEENEYWQGSWANWQVGATMEDFYNYERALSVSLDGLERNVTHIASEAACSRVGAFQHGAYYSGLREAQYCIKELHDEKFGGSSLPMSYEPTPQFCDVAPDGGLGNAFIRPSKATV